MLRTALGFPAIVFLSLVGAALAQDSSTDWPAWRGERGDGVAESGNPPLVWSETENVKWKTSIPGQGSASPIVWQDQIFLLTAIKTDRPTDTPTPPRTAKQPKIGGSVGISLPAEPDPTHYHQFLVISLDRNSGRVQWQRVATEQVPYRGFHQHHGYASGSPVTDGRRLYASFGSQGLYCYDLQGQLLWSRDLGDMETYADFGETITPALHGDTLVVVHDHLGDSFIVALDAATGETRWEAARENEISGWCTPLIVEREGVTQVVVSGGAQNCAYDLATGEVLWRCEGLRGAVIPHPVLFNDTVLCMTGYPEQNLFAIRLGDVDDTERIVWRFDHDTAYVPSPLLYDDTLYFLKHNKTILTTVDATTGETRIEAARLPGLQGNIYASPVAADGRVYLTARNGTTLVIKHGTDKIEKLAINRLDEGIDASAAIVGGQIILRGRDHVYCIEAE